MTEPRRARRHSRRGRSRTRSTGSPRPTSMTGPWNAGSSWRSRSSGRRDPAIALISNVEDTVYSDSVSRVALANSAGFAGSFEQHAVLCVCLRVRRRGPGPHDRPGRRGRRAAPTALDPDAIGHEAADRALALHGARQPSSRRCPVVLDPFVAASFASVIGRTLSADAVQRGRSLFAGKEGEQIADRAVAPDRRRARPDGLATAPFDGEGVPQQRTALIEDGTLQTYLYDAYTARGARARLDRQRRARLLPHAALGGADEPAASSRATHAESELLARPAKAST